MSQTSAVLLSSPSDVVPLIRRIQKALLDGRTLSIEDTLYTWAPRNGDLPDIDSKDENAYQAREAGVFQAATWQSGQMTGKKWVRLCALDALDDVLGPRLGKLSEPERSAFSADLSFQVVMGEEQEARARRRRSPVAEPVSPTLLSP